MIREGAVGHHSAGPVEFADHANRSYDASSVRGNTTPREHDKQPQRRGKGLS